MRSERRLARRASSRFRAAILAPQLGRHFQGADRSPPNPGLKPGSILKPLRGESDRRIAATIFPERLLKKVADR